MHKLLTFAGRCNLVHMQLLDALLFWWLLSFVVCICVERERKGPIFSYHAAMFPWTIYTVPL